MFETGFVGHEVVAIMERDLNGDELWSYELLATTRTSTMEREMRDAGRRGFALRGQLRTARTRRASPLHVDGGGQASRFP